MADKKNLCAQIDTALHMRVRQEQERSGRTLSEFVEQLITDYYKMKEGTKMTGDMRTMAIQLPEELFERLKAYLKKNNLKQKQFIIGLIEDALEQDEEDTAEQRRQIAKAARKQKNPTNRTWMPKKNNHPTGSRGDRLRLPLLHLQARCGIVEIADGRCGA